MAANRADRALVGNAHAIKLTVHIGSLGAWGIGTTWEEAEQAAHTAAKDAHPGLTVSQWQKRKLASAWLFIAKDPAVTTVVEFVQNNAISPHLVQIRLQ